MSAAKVASDHDKPDGLVVVEPGEVREFLAPLPVEDIHGVGPVTAGELAEMGVETAGDLAVADPGELRERFGERGPTLRARARGDDDRAVTPTGRPKSLSRESAFAEATADPDRVRETITALAADVAGRADGEGALYRTVGIKAVTPPYDVNTRERSLPGPVSDPDLVREVALDLLAEFSGDPVRKLGVRVSNLDFSAADQSKLGGWEGNGEGGDGDGDAERGAAEADDAETATADPTAGQSSLADFGP
jgi:DNA polymerase IV (DinB-like DNA polymerase)